MQQVLGEVPGIYQVPVVRVCSGPFAYVADFVPHLDPLRVAFFVNYTRTTVLRSDCDIANIQHSTGRAIRSAQAPPGITKSLVALIHEPPLSAPFIFRKNLPCVSV